MGIGLWLVQLLKICPKIKIAVICSVFCFFFLLMLLFVFLQVFVFRGLLKRFYYFVIWFLRNRGIGLKGRTGFQLRTDCIILNCNFKMVCPGSTQLSHDVRLNSNIGFCGFHRHVRGYLDIFLQFPLQIQEILSFISIIWQNRMGVGRLHLVTINLSPGSLVWFLWIKIFMHGVFSLSSPLLPMFDGWFNPFLPEFLCPWGA